MANIRTGFGIAEISGKVGNDVYARNPHGQYVRSNTKPIQPDSTLQLNRRSQFADVVNAYQELSKKEYLQWDSYAKNFKFKNKLGQLYTPSGYQMFISCNVNIIKFDFDIIFSPEPYKNFIVNNNFEIKNFLGSNFMTLSGSWPSNTFSGISIETSGILSHGTVFVRNQFRTINDLFYEKWNDNDYDLYANFDHYFQNAASIDASSNIIWKGRFIDLNSGIASARFPIKFTNV